jgi:cytochrome oxidase Cu insertion factor (SCO1/SenC/PrrC family)
VALDWDPMAARRLAVALLALGLLAWPAHVRADGDPASDVLLSQSLFAPSDTPAPAAQQTELSRLLQSAKRAGYPIRVALVPSDYDLGSVTPLWRKPQIYAHFLGVELSDVYTGPLLVAMPNGFGFWWSGHGSTAAYRTLAGVPLTAGLVGGTQTAVLRLAAASGVRLSPPAPVSSPAAHATDPVAIVLPALALVLIAFALTRTLIRRRATRPERTQRPRRERRPMPAYAPWVLSGLAVVLAVAVATPIALSLRHTNTNATANAALSAPFTWPAARQPAPNFHLSDQNSQPVSLSAYRGRPVIVTFIDPLCRNLCPLAAQVLDQADRELPASQRAPIIAVSIDIYADTHADLEQDFGRWRLVPQWQWAVGTPRQLAVVWRDYKVGVTVVDKQIAGTTIHEITHDEVAYVIDPNGYERALFVWPYYPQDVIKELRALERT